MAYIKEKHSDNFDDAVESVLDYVDDYDDLDDLDIDKLKTVFIKAFEKSIGSKKYSNDIELIADDIFDNDFDDLGSLDDFKDYLNQLSLYDFLDMLADDHEISRMH